MKSIVLLALTGLLLPLPAAIVFPANNLVKSDACNLPNTPPAAKGDPPASLTFTIRSDAGNVNLFGLPERNTFLHYELISAVVTPASDQNVTVNIDAPALSFGANKAYIGFFTGTSSEYAGFVTIEIDCTPQSSITLIPAETSTQVEQGSSPNSILLAGAITATAGKSVAFTMTPDTPSSVSPWLVSGSVPGSPANTGVVNTNAAQDLTVNINPAGLAVQPAPYIGYLHVRDNQTGYGSADLTVNLSVTAPTTGNSTLPHIAVDSVYTTDFSLVNTASQPANYAINFYNDAGTPFSVLVQGKGKVPGFSGTLPANGSAYFQAGDPAAGAVSGGSARVIADASVGVQAIFRLRQTDNTGTHYYEAAVPATTGSKEFVMPFDLTNFGPTGEQIYTGIAIANLDPVNAAVVSCVARDGNGATIPNAVSVPSIPASGHWAGFNFSALFGKRGIIDCAGSTTIGAIGVHAFGVSGAISSLPVFLK